jgi:hypothetical protein
LDRAFVVLDRRRHVVGGGEHVADHVARDLLGAHALADLADAQIEELGRNAGRLFKCARDRRGAGRADKPGIERHLALGLCFRDDFVPLRGVLGERGRRYNDGERGQRESDAKLHA